MVMSMPVCSNVSARKEAVGGLGVMSAETTNAPAAAYASAMALPRPEDAPVMRATLLERSPIFMLDARVAAGADTEAGPLLDMVRRSILSMMLIGWDVLCTCAGFLLRSMGICYWDLDVTALAETRNPELISRTSISTLGWKSSFKEPGGRSIRLQHCIQWLTNLGRTPLDVDIPYATSIGF